MIDSMLEALDLNGLAWALGYWTVRLLAPPMTLGQVRVQGLLEGLERRYRMLPMRRQPAAFVVHPDTAALLGLVLWCVGLTVSGASML